MRMSIKYGNIERKDVPPRHFSTYANPDGVLRYLC